jgi:hypothetical protein
MLAAYLLVGKAAGLFNSRAGFLAAFIPFVPFLVFLSVGNWRTWRAAALSPEQEAFFRRSVLTRDLRMRMQAQRGGLVGVIGIWLGALAALVEVEWRSSLGHIVGGVLIASFGVAFLLMLTTAMKGRPRFLIPRRLRGRPLYDRDTD